MNERFNQESEQHRAENDQLSRVREILDEAKGDGKADWMETGEEFVIKFGEREVHIPKWAKTPILNSESGEMSSAPLEKVIKAFLADPEAGEKGRLGKGIEDIDNRENSDNINS